MTLRSYWLFNRIMECPAICPGPFRQSYGCSPGLSRDGGDSPENIKQGKVVGQVKITLKSTFNLTETELETASVTLRALLDELSNDNKLTEIEFFDRESGEPYPDCEVFVNGQPHRLLAHGLDTRLEDGDEVEIILLTLTGG